MSTARFIVPGGIHFVGRRCSERRYFLRPSKKTNQLVSYCLGRAAAKYGVLLHAYVFMSNHYHLVVTDVRGVLPAFMQYLDQLLARSLNAQLGRWESFWAPGSYDDVLPQDTETVLTQMVYTVANPVKARLVSASHRWPGVVSLPRDVGVNKVVQRPKGFFREKGPMPRYVTLRLDVPLSLSAMGEHAFAELFQSQVLAREARLRQQHAQAGQRFLGRRGVLALDPFVSPTTRAIRRAKRKRVAAQGQQKLRKGLELLAAFQQAYQQARERFNRGLRDTVFPAGTYALRVHVGVRCAAAG